MVSALLRIPVKKDIAMTGEITLRGKVLPIGGLKEKLLAAHRGLLKTIIIPKENEKDLKEVPKLILSVFEIHGVEHLDEVLRHAMKIAVPEILFKNKNADLVLDELYPKPVPPPDVDKGKAAEIVAH